MGIRHAVLSPDESEAAEQIATAMKHIQNTGEAYALVVCKDTFAPYTLQNTTANNLSVSREEAIQAVANATSPDDVIVSTTGMISRELFEYRTRQGQGHERDFLTVGSMGHASQIALGIALEKPCHRVWCFDGDGAALMHLGALAIIGQRKPTNFRHVVFNNGAHDSVGGQPTVGLDIDLPAIASAVGYRAIYSVDTLPALTKLLNDTSSADGPLLIQVCVKKGNRKDLGRPTTTPIQNKDAFMEFLKD